MAPESDAPTVLSPADERRVLWLAVIFVILLVGLLAATSYAIWPRDDLGALVWRPGEDFNIMWVPIAIIEWAFAGAMVSVLYRLATRRGLPAGRSALYTWVIARPVIGLFLGGLVYFLALAGAKLLDGKLTDALWLNVVAFVGGFSEDLSVGLIQRFVRRRLGDDARDDAKREG
ncbi:MAG TPA: hypothetical protein VGS57_05780 [Thermoanaerobaculia bacterium]|jgi:hypothetical protein|nr:hypothetical protein [Thermoanaerobaculia bacterium]